MSKKIPYPWVEELGFRVSLAGEKFNKYPVIAMGEILRVFGTDTERCKNFFSSLNKRDRVLAGAGVSIGSVDRFLTNEKSKEIISDS